MINLTENILIVGSQNANLNDRSLKRSDIKSVQLLSLDGKLEEITFFNSLGELGISSICWKDTEPLVWYYTTGIEIVRLDLKTGSTQEFKIAKLRGVHEISIIDDILWISNTYFDELISFDLTSKTVVERLKLKSSAQLITNLKESDVDVEDQTRENKFHCNQLFKSYTGEVMALVHHVNGEQLINRVAQKLIKSQGNGGVLAIRTGKAKRLKLKAPHSVRKVNGQYWIFDSGHAQLNVYNSEWKLIKETNMAGWGRGGDHSMKHKLFYAGVSAKRNRYLAFNEENKGENMVQVFDFDLNLKEEFVISNVEQINNVYLISDKQLELIRKL